MEVMEGVSGKQIKLESLNTEGEMEVKKETRTS